METTIQITTSQQNWLIATALRCWAETCEKQLADFVPDYELHNARQLAEEFENAETVTIIS